MTVLSSWIYSIDEDLYRIDSAWAQMEQTFTTSIRSISKIQKQIYQYSRHPKENIISRKR